MPQATRWIFCQPKPKHSPMYVYLLFLSSENIVVVFFLCYLLNFQLVDHFMPLYEDSKELVHSVLPIIYNSFKNGSLKSKFEFQKCCLVLNKTLEKRVRVLKVAVFSNRRVCQSTWWCHIHLFACMKYEFDWRIHNKMKNKNLGNNHYFQNFMTCYCMHIIFAWVFSCHVELFTIKKIHVQCVLNYFC